MLALVFSKMCLPSYLFWVANCPVVGCSIYHKMGVSSLCILSPRSDLMGIYGHFPCERGRLIIFKFKDQVVQKLHKSKEWDAVWQPGAGRGSISFSIGLHITNVVHCQNCSSIFQLELPGFIWRTGRIHSHVKLGTWILYLGIRGFRWPPLYPMCRYETFKLKARDPVSVFFNLLHLQCW